jgi:hypothetical protein
MRAASRLVNSRENPARYWPPPPADMSKSGVYGSARRPVSMPGCEILSKSGLI